MLLDRQLAIKVYGRPAPKGSLRSVGQGRMVDDNPATSAWRKQIIRAGHAWQLPEPLDGPLILEATITLERPATVKPKKRPWPHIRSPGHGDIDKLARTILDGLQDAQVLTDDAQIVQLVITKVYPDTPGAVDQLHRPGATIRILPAILEEQP